MTKSAYFDHSKQRSWPCRCVHSSAALSLVLCSGWASAREPRASEAPAQAAEEPPTTDSAADSPQTSGEDSLSEEARMEAKQRFDRGLELYREGDHALALIEFQRAYEITRDYRVLYNIGQVGIQLGRYANALKALQEYLAAGGDAISESRREMVARDVVMLKGRTALMTVRANVSGAELLVDEVVVGTLPLEEPLLVDAGVHQLTMRKGGYMPRTGRITLAGGDEQVVSWSLEKVPAAERTIVVRERVEKDNSRKNLMVAGWAATGALAAGAVVTGIMGAGEHSELRQLRQSPGGDPNLRDALDDASSNARSLFLASDVFSGAALLVGGLSLWLTVTPEKEGGSTRDSQSKDEGLQIGYSRGQIRLRGTF